MSHLPDNPFDAGGVHGWLAVLAARHGDELRGYLARFAQGSADVEDWLQEALLRVYAAGLDRQLECPRAYLFRVARNVALGRLEHRKVRRAAKFDIEMADRARVELPPVHVTAQYDEDTRRLREAIEQLPARCREAFVLCKMHGFTQKETSCILGISVSTVEKHLSRGLKLCRAMLLGEAPTTPSTSSVPVVHVGRRKKRVAR